MKDYLIYSLEYPDHRIVIRASSEEKAIDIVKIVL